jgi:hypothetical protein
MNVVPITHRANEIVAQWHRHNKPVRGCRFALGAEQDGELVGVVVVGRPVSRKLDKQNVAEVTRLCVPDVLRKALARFYTEQLGGCGFRWVGIGSSPTRCGASPALACAALAGSQSTSKRPAHGRPENGSIRPCSINSKSGGKHPPLKAN